MGKSAEAIYLCTGVEMLTVNQPGSKEPWFRFKFVGYVPDGEEFHLLGETKTTYEIGQEYAVAVEPVRSRPKKKREAA